MRCLAARALIIHSSAFQMSSLQIECRILTLQQPAAIDFMVPGASDVKSDYSASLVGC